MAGWQKTWKAHSDIRKLGNLADSQFLIESVYQV